MIDLFKKQEILRNVSNIKVANLRAKLYLGQDTELMISTRKNKKYMVRNPYTDDMIHFGDIRYADYTKTLDEKKRKSYRARFEGILGEFVEDPYSPYNLSLNILW